MATQRTPLTPGTRDALARLVTHHGFFGSLLYELMRLEETTEAPIAATDGRRIMLHPQGFGARPMQERVFILGHETMHAILDHMGRGAGYAATGIGPDGHRFEADLYHRAAEYVVNAICEANGLGPCPADGVIDRTGRFTATSTVEDVYNVLAAERRAERQQQAQQQQQQQQQQDDGQQDDGQQDDDSAEDGDAGQQAAGDAAGDAQDEDGTDAQADGASGASAGQQPATGAPVEPGGFDQHMAPPAPGTEGAEERRPNRAELERALMSAAAVAKSQGQEPGAGLREMIDAISKPADAADWREILRNYVTAATQRDATSWRRLNRRRLALTPSICYPGKTGGAGFVAVQIDTSGSIGDEELALFMRELAVILDDCQPSRVAVLWTDDSVARVDEIANPYELEGLEAPGGGGTDMRAGISWLAEHDETPDCLITFTDGLTPYPAADDLPAYPLIWAISPSAFIDAYPSYLDRAKACGEVVRLRVET